MSNGGDRTSDVIRHHWDRRARTFDDEAGHGLVSDGQRQAWLELLSSAAGQTPARALDVGCGTGFLALRLAELGHTVTGVDLSPQMIEQARGKADRAGFQIDFQVSNAVELDSADETYDLLVARHVIWNLPDPERAVAEWLRVLRRGGLLLLIEGRWADNEALQRSLARPSSRLLARAIDAAAAVVRRTGRSPAKLLSRKYARIEVQLPFSGGPSSERLADFLRANSVEEVSVSPLMDPVLWGESPEFPRYLVAGTRSTGTAGEGQSPPPRIRPAG
jgi:ubiquinone/menaquinone biosynthesis C-methylase UbiE